LLAQKFHLFIQFHLNARTGNKHILYYLTV
jgi:hypothetical protein